MVQYLITLQIDKILKEPTRMVLYISNIKTVMMSMVEVIALMMSNISKIYHQNSRHWSYNLHHRHLLLPTNNLQQNQYKIQKEDITYKIDIVHNLTKKKIEIGMGRE